MNTETVYSNGAMLQWTGHFAEMMDISPEKIKLLNVCQKKKNVIPSIESHKRVLVFADSSHKSLFTTFGKPVWVIVMYGTEQESLHPIIFRPQGSEI